MKYRKIQAGLIVILSVFAFSCASKPAPDETNIESQIKDELREADEETAEENDTEASEENDSAESENEVELSEETTVQEESESDADEQEEENQEETEESEEDIALEEEKVEADNLDELPDLEKADEQEEISEPEPVEEPEVQDEPDAENEKTAENSESQDKEAELENSENTDNDKNEIIVENSDTAEENQTAEEEKEETEETETTVEEPAEEKEEAPVPSRTITISKNQFIDIYYPGKGWIYQGCLDSEGNIDSRNKYFIFGGRKLGGNDQCFILRSRAAGTYLLHFFKNDGLTGDYIDDYLEVIVEDKIASSNEHITVPSYADIIPPKVSITKEKIEEQKKQQKKALEEEKKNNEAAASEKSNTSSKQKKTADAVPISAENTDETVSTIIQTSESAPSAGSPLVEASETKKTGTKTAKKTVAEDKNEESDFSEKNLEKLNEENLLKTAQKLYEAKDFEAALRAITKFFDKASKNIDKGLYLQGQILEEKSSVQNIKDAIESYDLLVKNYPASTLWDKAKKRSIFLRRFYINIR